MNLTIYKLIGIALCLLLASYVSHAGKYKIQVSEQSGRPGTSVKLDQNFREWDRILRKYDGMMTEFQTRLIQ